MKVSETAQNHRIRLTPRVKVWLELQGEYVFGFGISQILKSVEATGSIKAAAEQLGKSYRHIWGRIKQAEGSLGNPLVETRVGGAVAGRSSLTELGTRLVADYDALRARMLKVVEAEFSSRFDVP
jgi:molybdate transport system regulatory protein